MTRVAKLSFGIAVLFFAAFMVNVVTGAMQHKAAFSDVIEMLLLFASCIFFVVAVLALERDERAGQIK